MRDTSYHAVTCKRCGGRFAQVLGCEIVPPHVCKKKNTHDVNLMSFRIELEALITEREAMRWENEHALMNGNSVPYGEEAFYTLNTAMLNLKKTLENLE